MWLYVFLLSFTVLFKDRLFIYLFNHSTWDKKKKNKHRSFIELHILTFTSNLKTIIVPCLCNKKTPTVDIIHFPHFEGICNRPTGAAYGAYISQLCRYARGFSLYSDFLQVTVFWGQNCWVKGFLKSCLILYLKKRGIYWCAI